MNYLAIDVGGTTTKYGLLTEEGLVLETGSVSTKRRTETEFIAQLVSLAVPYRDRIAGIGIALPGIVDTQAGLVIASASLPFIENVPFVARLRQALGRNLSIALENDGNAAALAEHAFGQLKGCANSAMVVLGTGVGAALFLNNQLYTGSHFVAGEPSFMVTDGLLPIRRENTAAGLSAVDTVAALADALGISGEDIGRRVFAELPQSEPAVQDIFGMFTTGVAALIYNMHVTLDLDRVAVGGGISSQPLVIEQLGAAVEAYRQVTPLAARTLHPLPIVAAQFHNSANLIGAIVPLLG